ncbi:MAG: nucleotidyltransferase family protein, partial [Halodesulfurarchaeum sp.]
MQAVVPAAGEGTRLRPLTEDRPKGLVEIAGQPLLAHVFESLVELGIEEIVTVVGYRGDDIVEHFGRSFRDASLSYVWQEAPKGVADALLQARDAVDGDVVLYNGDNLFDADLDRVLEVHRARNPGATLLVDSVDEEAARRTGVVVRDDDGTVTGF